MFTQKTLRACVEVLKQFQHFHWVIIGISVRAKFSCSTQCLLGERAPSSNTSRCVADKTTRLVLQNKGFTKEQSFIDQT